MNSAQPQQLSKVSNVALVTPHLSKRRGQLCILISIDQRTLNCEISALRNYRDCREYIDNESNWHDQPGD